MKKHHATILIVIGLLAILLATNMTLNTNEQERQGYSISQNNEVDALACCTVEGKTCYSFGDSCAICDAFCG